MKNIFLISARRSGTHLLTDLIVNNFKYQRINNNIDYDFLSNDNVETFINEMSIGNKLAWSHYHDYDNFFKKELDEKHILKLKEIFQSSKIIYIYRDIRDVITSYYNRWYIFNKFSSFDDFIQHSDLNDYRKLANNENDNSNIVDILTTQHKNWFSVYFAKELLDLDIELISYEEIINNYNNSVKKIGNFLNKLTKEILDVRLKSLKDQKIDIVYTHNEFRSGNVGDWIETFGQKLGDEIISQYNIDIKNHIDAYIDNPQLYDFHEPEKKHYQINSQDWKLIEKQVDNELIQYNDYFIEFKNNFDVNFVLKHRYEICERKLDDVRYKHKVFYFKNYVLKFIYPCKANLDKKTFDYVNPVASKINLLKIIKANDVLFNSNVVPKLYYAGINNGFLFVIQERIDDNLLIPNLYNIHYNWNWMLENNIFNQMLEHFFNLIKHNILLCDCHSPFNWALNNNDLIYLDLDGIQIFNNKNDLINSIEYVNMIKFLKKIDLCWYNKHGFSQLENFEFF